MDDGLSNKHPGKVLSTVEGFFGWLWMDDHGSHWYPWLKKNPIQGFFSLSFWFFNLKL